MMSRGFLFAACFGIAIPVAIAALPAQARPAAAQRAASSLAVDVSRLRALGLGPTADLIGETIARELDGIPGAGGRVVVRMTGLSMNVLGGVESGGGGGGDGGGAGGGAGENDYLEGEVLRVGPAGEILQRRPIVMSLPANSGGAYYLPGSEQRRVIELSRNFARWVKRDGM